MLLPLAAIAAAGCGMLVSAGRLESLGLLEAARRRARSGGLVAAAGSVTTAGAALLLPGSWLPRAAVAALALSAGFAALLAGASGKPRPTVWAAVALLLGAVVVARVVVR